MPKRIATPPLADNTNYFTVYFPYPLNANWELKGTLFDSSILRSLIMTSIAPQADQKTFARWIACILPIQYCSAIMYKPSVGHVWYYNQSIKFIILSRLGGWFL